jgi:vitamin B12 transporter
MKPWICAAVLGMLSPSVLHAQEPTDTVELTPVVVTATRLPRPAAEVPVLVTVLSGAELRAQGIHMVFDALRDVPGAAVFQTGSFGGQTSLFLRGGQSNYVKVLVDGVPVNQPGGAFDFANLTTDNVGRIEVLRGPASVLYGSDAVTGVVQIFTRRGVGPARAEMRVRGGSHGTLDWDAQTSAGGRAASYSFAVSRVTSDGIYAFNNEYHNTVASGLVRAAPDDRTDATLTFRYADNAYHFPTDGAGVPLDHNQFNYGNGPTIGLDVGHYFTPRLEARLLLAANEAEGGYDNQPDSPADSNLYHSLDRFRRSSADLRANLHLPAGSVLTAGAAFEQQHDRSTNVCQSAFGDCTTPPIDTSRWNRALYAQLVSGVAQRVSLVAGARLEDNQRFGTYGTYRAGAVYRLTAGTRVRGTAGNSFREPTFFENYATGFSLGNPNLRPEHARSWELGLEQSLARGRANLSATFFDQRFGDLIDYNPSAAPPTPNYENIAGATANGVELGIHAAPGPLSLGVSYAYLRTDVTNPGFDSTSGAALASGRQLVRRPKHSARLDVGYRIPARGTLSLAVTYVGARQDQDFSTFPFPRVTLPSYTRVDLAGEAELLRPRGSAPGLAASARIENLLNVAYQEVKNFPGRARTVFVGAQVRFGY